MYIKLTDETPEVYSLERLRLDHPDTSFPDVMTNERLAEWGVFPVIPTDCPLAPPGKIIEEALPLLIDGEWKQQWTLRDATAEETLARATEVRNERNSRLSNTDWSQGRDIPDNIQQLFAPYRQALRDVPEQPGFPWDILWPMEPN
jgi:hypothetical protein